MQEEDELITCFVVIAEWEYGILHCNDHKQRRQLRIQGDLILSNVSRVIESSKDVNVEYGR